MVPSFNSRDAIEESIEETTIFAPKFGTDGLIPVVATDASNGRMLMLAWMNADALHLTLAHGEAHYWSRSRQALWRKGESSGNIQKVIEVRTDCDQDALQLIVEQTGPACHTDRRSCFYRVVAKDAAKPGEIQLIQRD